MFVRYKMTTQFYIDHIQLRKIWLPFSCMHILPSYLSLYFPY